MNIEEVKNVIHKYEYIKEKIEEGITKDMEVNEIVYRLYLLHEDIKTVSKIINDMGYKITTNRGKRKFTHKDVSEILKDNNAINDQFLNEIVTSLFNSKKKNYRY